MNRVELLKSIIADKEAIIKYYERRVFRLEKCIEAWQQDELLRPATAEDKNANQ